MRCLIINHSPVFMRSSAVSLGGLKFKPGQRHGGRAAQGGEKTCPNGKKTQQHYSKCLLGQSQELYLYLGERKSSKRKSQQQESGTSLSKCLLNQQVWWLFVCEDLICKHQKLKLILTIWHGNENKSLQSTRRADSSKEREQLHKASEVDWRRKHISRCK